MMLSDQVKGAWTSNHPFLNGTPKQVQQWYDANAHFSIVSNTGSTELRRKRAQEIKTTRLKHMHKRYQEIFHNAGSDGTRPTDIIQAVARHFDVPAHQITGHSRRQKYVIPRKVVCFLMHRHNRNPTLSSIGRRLNRDHTTIISALNSVEDNFDKYSKHIDAIEIGLMAKWSKPPP